MTSSQWEISSSASWGPNVGQHAAHDFLMPVVTGAMSKGDLGELDGLRVAERDEQERQVRQQRHVERVDVEIMKLPCADMPTKVRMTSGS